jgi:hypothetical protein
MPEACLRIGRIQSGYVDSFTGEPRLRRAVDDEPARPAEHVSRAEPLFMAPPEIPRRNGFDQNPDVADGHCDAARPAAVSHTEGSAQPLNSVGTRFGRPRHWSATRKLSWVNRGLRSTV